MSTGIFCKQYPFIKHTTNQNIAFDDVERCEVIKKSIRNKTSTNDNFKSFTQCFKTIATYNELKHLIRKILIEPPSRYIDIKESLKHISPKTTSLLNTLDTSLGIYEYTQEAVVNTLRYVFEYHKRGIFVQIRNGQITIFAPFSNVDYKNSLSKDNIDKARKLFSNKISKNGWVKDPSKWYADGCLIKPGKNWICNTPDWYYAEYYYLLQHMLKRHKSHINDIDFIINTANFPLFRGKKTANTTKWFHPHEMIVDSFSAKPPGVLKIPCPVFSSFKSDHNDIFIPSGYDIDMASGKIFLGTSSNTTGCSHMFPKLEDKITFLKKFDKIVWRGGLSNCGGSRKTSCRFKIASLQNDIVDAKITDANNDAVRKTIGIPIKTTDVVKPTEIGNKLNRTDFLKYKYILMLGGTNTNASLPYFLQSNSIVVFGGDNNYKMWYSEALKHNEHYIRINCDSHVDDITKKLEMIVEKGKSKEGKSTYKDIIKNAQRFYKNYINMNLMADYLYLTLNSIQQGERI